MLNINSYLTFDKKSCIKRKTRLLKLKDQYIILKVRQVELNIRDIKLKDSRDRTQNSTLVTQKKRKKRNATTE